MGPRQSESKPLLKFWFYFKAPTCSAFFRPDTNICFLFFFVYAGWSGSESVAWEYSIGAWQQTSKRSQWVNNRSISNYAPFYKGDQALTFIALFKYFGTAQDTHYTRHIFWETGSFLQPNIPRFQIFQLVDTWMFLDLWENDSFQWNSYWKAQEDVLFFGGRFLEKDKLEMANLSSNFVAKVVSHWLLELCSIL